jgi:hypothetical protein
MLQLFVGRLEVDWLLVVLLVAEEVLGELPELIKAGDWLELEFGGELVFLLDRVRAILAEVHRPSLAIRGVSLSNEEGVST